MNNLEIGIICVLWTVVILFAAIILDALFGKLEE
jgi:hypothetical protein